MMLSTGVIAMTAQDSMKICAEVKASHDVAEPSELNSTCVGPCADSVISVQSDGYYQLECASCSKSVDAVLKVTEIQGPDRKVPLTEALTMVLDFRSYVSGNWSRIEQRDRDEAHVLCKDCEPLLESLYTAFVQFVAMMNPKAKILAAVKDNPTEAEGRKGSIETPQRSCLSGSRKQRGSTNLGIGTHAMVASHAADKNTVVTTGRRRLPMCNAEKGKSGECRLEESGKRSPFHGSESGHSSGFYDESFGSSETEGAGRTRSRRRKAQSNRSAQKSSRRNHPDAIDNRQGRKTEDHHKSKRFRNWRKESWLEKAKNDPSRTCDLCGKAFIFPAVMKRHKKIVHQGLKPYECVSCGKSFSQKVILNKHTCDFSKEPGNRDFLQMTREEQLRKFVCNVCGKRFKYLTHLTLHEMNHRNERPFPCSKCEKSFRRPDHLKYHIRIVHVEEKKFICTKCGQTFKSISSLRAHEKKHVSDQGHLCNICGKSIKSMYQMSRHQKTHRDELPFQCQVCGKRFKMKDYLGQHLRRGKTCSRKLSPKQDSCSNISDPAGSNPRADDNASATVAKAILHQNGSQKELSVQPVVNVISVSSMEFAC